MMTQEKKISCDSDIYYRIIKRKTFLVVIMTSNISLSQEKKLFAALLDNDIYYIRTKENVFCHDNKQKKRKKKQGRSFTASILYLLLLLQLKYIFKV